jgi:hypothetical protein
MAESPRARVPLSDVTAAGSRDLSKLRAEVKQIQRDMASMSASGQKLDAGQAARLKSAQDSIRSITSEARSAKTAVKDVKLVRKLMNLQAFSDIAQGNVSAYDVMQLASSKTVRKALGRIGLSSVAGFLRTGPAIAATFAIEATAQAVKSGLENQAEMKKGYEEFGKELAGTYAESPELYQKLRTESKVKNMTEEMFFKEMQKPENYEMASFMGIPLPFLGGSFAGMAHNAEVRMLEGERARIKKAEADLKAGRGVYSEIGITEEAVLAEVGKSYAEMTGMDRQAAIDRLLLGRSGLHGEISEVGWAKKQQELNEKLKTNSQKYQERETKKVDEFLLKGRDKRMAASATYGMVLAIDD